MRSVEDLRTCRGYPFGSTTTVAELGYDPSEERDSAGKWTSSGGDTAGAISDKLAANPEGFTVDLNGKEVTEGIAVAADPSHSLVSGGVPSKAEIAAWIETNAATIAASGNIGGWHDKEANKTVLDPVDVLPESQLDSARRLGSERDQKAIFNLRTGEEIDTGGTGGYG